VVVVSMVLRPKQVALAAAGSACSICSSSIWSHSFDPLDAVASGLVSPCF
jgi:hypothetical protein